MPNPPIILIRADASQAIGSGHVMRCLALAQAWHDAGGNVMFAISEAPAALKQRLTAEGFPVTSVEGTPGSEADAASTAKSARQLHAAWIVVDGDRFTTPFLSCLSQSGIRIMLMDDFALRESYPADLVINSNLGFTEQDYENKVPRRALLIGSSYVFLRREFSAIPLKRVFPKKGKRILVTLGGSDPENLGPKIALALARNPGYEITLVVGPGYEHAIDSALKVNRRIRIVKNPPNLRTLMEAADVSIIAGGGTSWELLYLGCVVLSYSRNSAHKRIVEELAGRGAVRHLGATRRFDAAALTSIVTEVAESKRLREALSRAGRQILDGRGTERVLKAMRGFSCEGSSYI